MDIIKKIKELFEKKDRKKLVENTVIVIIIGIIAIIAGGSLLNGGNGNNKTDAANQAVVETSKPVAPEEDETEKKLQSILSQMQDVGKVDVMITYSAGKENIPAFDTKKSESSTEEKDSGGGTRNIDQSENDSTVVYEDNPAGGKQPVILKQMQPVVKGVLVVADGAVNPVIRQKILDAVQVILDVPAYKIEVVARKK